MNQQETKDLYSQVYKMGKSSVSYSQYNMFKRCPKQWQLQYLEKQGKWQPTIYNVFGNAMHMCIQLFLQTMYDKTVKEAESMDWPKILLETMKKEYSSEVEKNSGEHFSSREELSEFCKQGVEILAEFKKRRGQYFTKKKTELLGIELPVLAETNINPNVVLIGFMDVVLKEHDKIKIIDIKTATTGWNDYKKKQEGDQLRLYKRFFAKHFKRIFPNIPLSDIAKDVEVEYFILKRKIWENSDFPQRRIQIHRPANGTPSLNKTERSFNAFISEAFDKEGKRIKKEYRAISGPGGNNCKFCPFKADYDLCPKENRKLI